MRATPIAAAATIVLATVAAHAATAEDGARNWPAEKCARFRATATAVIARSGAATPSPGFVASIDAFVAGGCDRAVVAVCGATPADVAIIDRIVLLGVGQGLSGTFYPFRCP